MSMWPPRGEGNRSGESIRGGIASRDPASEEFGRWARAKAGVSPVEQTKPEPTYEEQVANAVAGGADGGAGHAELVIERNPSDVIREAAAIRRMRREL
jgi:hypothetical protein